MVHRFGISSRFRPALLALPLALAALFGGCATRSQHAAAKATVSAKTSEPLNLSDAKAAVLAYVDSGAYDRDFAAAAAEARAWIEQRAAARRAGERLAVVFDIDETVLSNLPHMRAEDFGYSPRDWADWVASANAPALAPMLDVFRAARTRDVAVLFLTGRRDPEERAATAENLARAGFSGYAALRLADSREAKLRTAAERKAAARAAWAAEGWTIIATVGDQESDLSGGNAERGFKLPNPFYLIP